MHLSSIDIAIVLIYVGATIAAGAIARSSIKGISDFLAAGRSLRTPTASATYISTGLGLVTVMYFAEEGFKNGFALFLFGIIAFATHMVIAHSGFIVSRLRHLRVLTVPEFYELKYSRGVRILGGLLLGIAGTLNMGLFPILGSRFVVGFTGLPIEYVNFVMVAMLIVVVIYTLMGGMVSVVLTDFAQFVLLSLGFLFGTYVILSHPLLGWDTIVESLEHHKGASAFDTVINPDFGWYWILYMFMVQFIGVVWQPEMMRPLSAENSRVARRVFWFSATTTIGRTMIPVFRGAAAFVWVNLPSHAGQYADDGRYAMPEMLGRILPIGIAGLMLAGMFAAFMSTHDSYLLAWSGVIVRDVISPAKALLAGSRQERLADDTWGGLTSEREVYWTRAVVVSSPCFCYHHHLSPQGTRRRNRDKVPQGHVNRRRFSCSRNRDRLDLFRPYS